MLGTNLSSIKNYLMRVPSMSEKHILHIEDNFHNRRIVRKILEKQGYVLHEAADGVIGFNMIHEMNPPLVLLDISLPGMDGIEIAQRVKADDDLKHIILIAVTASAMQGDRERFLAAGCDDYLSKPFRSMDLIDLVNQYYDQIPEPLWSLSEPKDAIHPIEEHAIPAEPAPVEEEPNESVEEHAILAEPAPIEEEANESVEEHAILAEPAPVEEEANESVEEHAILAEQAPVEEEPDESVDSLEDIGLLKTASLQGLFTDEELDEIVADETPSIEEPEGVEETMEPMFSMSFGEETETEDEEDDETITWVMPRKADELVESISPEESEVEEEAEDIPIEDVLETLASTEEEGLSDAEDHPSEESPAEPAESFEEVGWFNNAALQEIYSTEQETDEPPKEETPELDEPEAVDKLLKEVMEMQAEIDEGEGDEETAWDSPEKTDEFNLETGTLEAPELAPAPEAEEDEVPALISPTEAVEKLMAFSDEAPETEPAPDLEEEQPEPVAVLEEDEEAFVDTDDLSDKKHALKSDEAAVIEPEGAFDEIETIRPDADEESEMEQAPEVEALEALIEVEDDSRLDDTSPLKEEVVEPSMAMASRSKDPTNGTGQLNKKPGKDNENTQQSELTDQVSRMINPDMIRPADPNVGLESA
jgi:CheY-like chemotaxis protein